MPCFFCLQYSLATSFRKVFFNSAPIRYCLFYRYGWNNGISDYCEYKLKLPPHASALIILITPLEFMLLSFGTDTPRGKKIQLLEQYVQLTKPQTFCHKAMPCNFLDRFYANALSPLFPLTA